MASVQGAGARSAGDDCMNTRAPTEAETMDSIAHLRVPPHSIEAESSVLGGLLLDNTAWDRVGDLLNEGDFYRHEHRLIFGAIASLVNANKPADVITVAEHMERAGKTEEIGGMAYLNDLAQFIPSAGNIRRYAEIVRERAILRKLIQVGDEIATAGFNPQGRTVPELLDSCEQKIMGIGEDGAKLKGGFQSMDSLVVQVLDRIQEQADNPNELTGAATGFYDLDRMTAGLQAGDLVVLAARPSMGKALSLDSMLLTPSGWVRMGDIKLGDMVIGRDGLPYPVIGVYPQGNKQMYEVRFDDGASVVCCDEHLWFTSSRADRKAGRSGAVRQLSEIRKTLYAGGLERRLSHQIPWVEPMDFEVKNGGELLLDPYLLGLLLGDGSSNEGQVRFHNPEIDLVDKLTSLLPSDDVLVGAGKEWRIKRAKRNNQPSVTSDCMKKLGLLGKTAAEKFIPTQYLWSSASNRLALLRGLVDTDGYCYGSGVEYTTASADLANAVVFLVRSLGGRITRDLRETSFHYKGEKRSGLPSHRLHFAFDSDIVAVSSKKHLNAYRGVARRTGRYISDVKPVGVMPAQCITVAAPDGLFVTDDFVVTHNTALAVNIAEHIALNERLPVAVFSMEMGAAQLAVRVIGSIGRINQSHMRNGRLDNDEWSRMTDAVEKLRDAPLHIDETGGMTIGELRANARRLARQCGKIGLVVVDYIQLMSGAGDENRATELGEISRGLKLLAKELGCPVVALSQLSRAVESRTDKRPMMSDLRESGAIEQDADVIMFIYRDEYYSKEACKEPGVAEVIIAKQRNGPTGTVKLAFLKHLTRFESMAQSYAEPQYPSRPARPHYTDDR